MKKVIGIMAAVFAVAIFCMGVLAGEPAKDADKNNNGSSLIDQKIENLERERDDLEQELDKLKALKAEKAAAKQGTQDKKPARSKLEQAAWYEKQAKRLRAEVAARKKAIKKISPFLERVLATSSQFRATLELAEPEELELVFDEAKKFLGQNSDMAPDDLKKWSEAACPKEAEEARKVLRGMLKEYENMLIEWAKETVKKASENIK